jgi:hypothetical protein
MTTSGVYGFLPSVGELPIVAYRMDGLPLVATGGDGVTAITDTLTRTDFLIRKLLDQAEDGFNQHLGMPTATTGWVCFANNLSTHTAANSTVVQTASSASSVTVQGISDIIGAATWVSGDKIAFLCRAY